MDEQLELLRGIAGALGVTPGVGVTPTRVVQHALGHVFLGYKTTRPRGRAWQLERNLLKPFLLRYWRRPVRSIDAGDWDAHRRLRRKEKTRLGRAPSDLTLNLELKAIKRVFKWAVRRKFIDERPLIDCSPVKTRTRRGSWFTADQIDRLLAHADDLRWDHQQRTFRAIVAVMADTGLRISEALSLRWDRLTLRGVTSVVGKGAKTRVVAFTPRALTALARLDRHKINQRVFVNWRTGKAWDASTVRRWFKDAIAAARLEGVKADGDLALVPHVLRHSFASIADERGAPPGWIQQALGHSHASTTAVYLHRSEADAALRMAAIMGDRRPAKRVNRRQEKAIPVDEKTSRKLLRS